MRVTAMMLTMAAVLLVAGCGESARQDEPTAPHAGVAVRVACPDDTPRHVFERYGGNWADRVGAEQPQITDFDLKTDPVGRPDIVVIQPADLGKWADRIQPVPARLLADDAELYWRGVSPVYRDRLLVRGPRPIALPIIGDGRILVWDTERLNAPPATWQDAASLPARPPRPADPDSLERAFMDIAAPLATRPPPRSMTEADATPRAFSFQFDLADNTPRIDKPGFVEAARLLRAVYSEPAGDPIAAFREGKASFAVVSPAELPRLTAAGRKFAVAPLPGTNAVYNDKSGKQDVPTVVRVPYLGAGGWLAVVPRDAEHADAAFDLLADLAGPATSLLILSEPRWGAGPFRGVHLDDGNRRCWQMYDVPTDALVAAMRPFADPPVPNAPVRLRLPDGADYRADLAAALAADAPLADVAQKWAARVAAIVPDSERRSLLRLSAGLQRLPGE